MSAKKVKFFLAVVLFDAVEYGEGLFHPPAVGVDEEESAVVATLDIIKEQRNAFLVHSLYFIDAEHHLSQRCASYEQQGWRLAICAAAR